MPTNSKAVKGKRTLLITKAKTVSAEDFEMVLAAAKRGPHGLRDEVMLLLSFYAGLRPQEIAGLKWKRNVLDARGRLTDHVFVDRGIAKRTVERTIEMHPRLKDALSRLRAQRPKDKFIVYPLAARRADIPGVDPEQVAPNTLVQYFGRLYDLHGLDGCTSYSGRRSFITHLSRTCNLAGASIYDVARVAGHKSIQTTQGYLEEQPDKAALVGMMFA
ncbi:tip attachment protein [Bajunvirus bajun]|uniref:Integrase n=1 Tax=Brevundimonas phage vB_BgoS-Bajun TaxID=2948594 RepID=A0A9E7STG3_9CAUD|nr:tip attachment protein [Brevundimonas phage vB_BgoS-Bajun]